MKGTGVIEFQEMVAVAFNGGASPGGKPNRILAATKLLKEPKEVVPPFFIAIKDMLLNRE